MLAEKSIGSEVHVDGLRIRQVSEPERGLRSLPVERRILRRRQPSNFGSRGHGRDRELESLPFIIFERVGRRRRWRCESQSMENRRIDEQVWAHTQDPPIILIL